MSSVGVTLASSVLATPSMMSSSGSSGSSSSGSSVVLKCHLGEQTRRFRVGADINFDHLRKEVRDMCKIQAGEFRIKCKLHGEEVLLTDDEGVRAAFAQVIVPSPSDSVTSAAGVNSSDSPACSAPPVAAQPVRLTIELIERTTTTRRAVRTNCHPTAQGVTEAIPSVAPVPPTTISSPPPPTVPAAVAAPSEQTDTSVDSISSETSSGDKLDVSTIAASSSPDVRDAALSLVTAILSRPNTIWSLDHVRRVATEEGHEPHGDIMTAIDEAIMCEAMQAVVAQRDNMQCQQEQQLAVDEPTPTSPRHPMPAAVASTPSTADGSAPAPFSSSPSSPSSFSPSSSLSPALGPVTATSSVASIPAAPAELHSLSEQIAIMSAQLHELASITRTANLGHSNSTSPSNHASVCMSLSGSLSPSAASSVSASSLATSTQLVPSDLLHAVSSLTASVHHLATVQQQVVASLAAVKRQQSKRSSWSNPHRHLKRFSTSLQASRRPSIKNNQSHTSDEGEGHERTAASSTVLRPRSSSAADALSWTPASPSRPSAFRSLDSTIVSSPSSHSPTGASSVCTSLVGSPAAMSTSSDVDLGAFIHLSAAGTPHNEAALAEPIDTDDGKEEESAAMEGEEGVNPASEQTDVAAIASAAASSSPVIDRDESILPVASSPSSSASVRCISSSLLSPLSSSSLDCSYDVPLPSSADHPAALAHDAKLDQLAAMGFNNRVFSATLLHMNKGDMEQTIENLRQFYGR